MKATLEKLENSRATINVEVGLEKIEEAMEQAFRRVVRNTNIPGFRKGKAPRIMVERHVGRMTLWRDAMDDLLPKAYIQAVEMTGIEPVNEPDFEITHMEDGEPLAFKATVEVRPEVKLGDYRAVRVEKTVPEVSDDEVESFLNDLRERQARMITVEDGEASPGLYLWASYEGTIGDEEVSSGGQTFLMEMSESSLLPGLPEKLQGMKAGEEREAEISYPDDYEREELRGRQGKLKIRVHSVARKEIPALDDEFAGGMGYQGVEELRNEVQNKLRGAAEEEADRRAMDEAVEAVVGQAEVGPLPETLVHRRIHTLMHDLEDRLRQMGMTKEDYFSQTGTSDEELHEQFRERAEKEVKTELVLEEITRNEDLAVSDEEVRASLRQAGLPDEAAAVVRRSLGISKAAVFVKDSAIQVKELAS